MRVPRVFVPARLAEGARITLDERAARHVARVLRLGPGGRLRLFDGDGAEHEAVLREAGRTRVVAEIGPACAVAPEPAFEIGLALGVSRGERMDLALQKAVELGATRLEPLLTRRTVVRLEAERAERRRAHWRGVVIAACEQCGRARLPVLEPPRALADWLAERAPGDGAGVVLDPAAPRAFAELGPPGRRITVLVGPEGGLDEEERAAALRRGFEAVRLGPRTLRTETAAIAAVTAAQILWGDLGREAPG